MADVNSNRKRQQELRSQLRLLKEDEMKDCDHKPKNGRGRLISLSDYNSTHLNGKVRGNYPDTAVICTDCETIFDPQSYSPEEIESSLFMFRSMAEQVKLISVLNDSDKESMMNVYDAIKTLSVFSNFYKDMVKKVSGDRKGNGGNRSSAKGGIGLSSTSFGDRSY